ncbi:MAG: hypothetical protein ACUVXA_07180 [Candidatus Jordarchaeum sp.]|uniref:hypothetical protein n=1 Tax=Candidatus Jordarchaeum sp. TaxID=2823881 RepID=UPI00404AF9D8
MSEMKDFFNAIVYCNVFIAADKMGVTPVLLGRQGATVLAPVIDGLFKQIVGSDPPKTMGEFIKNIEKLGKDTGLYQIEIIADPSENAHKEKITNCIWTEMAKYAKTLGYNACPLCGIAVTIMGGIHALGLGEVNRFEAENNENVCILKLEMQQK